MTRRLKKWCTWGAMGCMMMMGAMATSCINEDLSDCGYDYELVYSLNLHTSLQTHIDQELTTMRERELGRRLSDALAGVFDEHAHDVALSFYGNDSLLTYYEEHEPDASTASFTIYLPIKDYLHLAVANNRLEENGVSFVSNSEAQHAALQVNPTIDNVIRSHQTGLFSARLPMEVKNYSQIFQANLYMLNSASALIINPNNMQITDIKGYVEGTATRFNVRDSIYSFSTQDVSVCTERLADTGSELICLYGVHFPSRNYAVRSRVEDAQDAIWKYRVYVTLSDGKVTETTLYFKEPLKAGMMHFVKAAINEQGALVPDDPKVGVSIELDWKPGGVFEPEM